MQFRCTISNVSGQAWRVADEVAIGWQVYDPDTGAFLYEGEWTRLARDVAPGESAELSMNLALPAADGPYRVYVSPIGPRTGWLYAHGEEFLIVDAEVAGGETRILRSERTTLARMRRARLLPALRQILVAPFRELWEHAGLIQSMTRREVLARYRGSLGDTAWTVLHPLLLMATYFFVFGVVLESRFGNDSSKTGFALYFLAGMLPWLAFSEPLARAPQLIVEHRNFVKKLVFPVAILPVNVTIAGGVTSLFATGIFLIALLIVRGSIPWTAVLLPALFLPQLFITAGLCWFLAALGVYLRDLTQVMTFLLTLWFFLTPICYPETSLPVSLIPVLSQNPMFQIVRGYRLLLLEGDLPALAMLAKLWALSAVVFLSGHAWFARLRRTFADVV
ncbi:MAG: ABC transporter permease [Bryobacterales bacterium]|nr:ABC transporter permease [Bryobacterales bacterium]